MRAVAAPVPHRGRLKLTSEGLAWLAAAAMLGLLGWSKSLNLLLMLSYAMFALLMLNGVLVRLHAGRARARRLLPASVFAGEMVETSVRLENAGSRPATFQVVDRGREWAAFDLARADGVAFSRTEAFLERGRLRLPPLSILAAYPFGFLSFERVEGEGDVVAVLPALGVAEPDGLRNWLLRSAGGEGRSRKVLRRVTHDHADVRGVRPYRPGDSLRAVHWRSSARRRELMVREYDAAPSPELLVVVDPWLPADATDADRQRLEDALGLAATITATWARAIGTRVTLAASGAVSIVAGEPGLRDALIPLADAAGSPSPAAPDAATIGWMAARAARVVVSSRANSPLADELAAKLGKPFARLDPRQPLPWYRPPRRGGAR
ncbi:MAG: DUF58 domain-containing protein [Gemmataceae bacterium]